MVSIWARADDEARGLSVPEPDLPLPGIFVRSAVFSDRADSLVSDLPKDGYESKFGPGPVGVCEPELLLPSFDGALPILSIRNYSISLPSSYLRFLIYLVNQTASSIE